MEERENVPVNLGPTDVEKKLIYKAKVEHKQTTQAAERALKVVVTTTEMARGTVLELHRQGQQLELAGNNVTQIGQEVKEASRLVRFMRRFCCLAVATSCCSCLDPGRHEDATRKARVKGMQGIRQEAAQQAAWQQEVKQQQVDELIRKTHTQEPTGDEAVRGELLGDTGVIRARRAREQQEERIGWGLPEEDHDELRVETRRQEQCLDQIAAAVDALSIMSQTMQEELVEQAPHLDQLAERTDAAHDDLRNVQRDAAKLAGRRPVAEGGRGMGGIERQAAAAATAARYAGAAATRAVS
ncbi:hypothetical protein N2152v2_004680 [Parachlorella kessleri]